jgi:hypothetical protein
MTQIARSYIQKNWLTLANFILLLGIAYKAGVAQTHIEEDTLHTRIIQTNHIKNLSAHMPLQEHIKIFVPRVEIIGQFENIHKQLDRIEKKLSD